jgi:GIY-YIG catalytic domain-containing protein
MKAWHKTGIYKIRSKSTDEIYIGRSIDIRHRWEMHRSDLKMGTHFNNRLQNIYNKFGKSDLDFSIVEECELDIIVEREQYYIDVLHPQINIKLDSDRYGCRQSRIYTNIFLVSPDGRVFTEINNLSKFCRDNDLLYESMYILLNHEKYRKSCGGWILMEDYEEPPEVTYFSDLSVQEKLKLAIL